MLWKRLSCFSDEGKHLMFCEFDKVEEFSQEKRVEAIGEKLSEIEKSLKSENVSFSNRLNKVEGSLVRVEETMSNRFAKVEESVAKGFEDMKMLLKK